MTHQADEHRQQDASSDVFVARVRKGDRCEIRAILREYEGQKLAELRTFVKRTDGTWTPTARGVTVPRERVGELADAASALSKTVGQGTRAAGRRKGAS